MYPQSFKNDAQETPRATQSKKQISKHTRSFQRRSTSKRCCGGVPRSVLNPPQHPQWCCQACKIPWSMSIYLLKSLRFLVGLRPWSPALAADLFSMSSLKSTQISSLIFDRLLKPKWNQNWSNLEVKILPKSIQNPIDFLIDFWMRFWSQNGSKMMPRGLPKSSKNL